MCIVLNKKKKINNQNFQADASTLFQGVFPVPTHSKSLKMGGDKLIQKLLYHFENQSVLTLKEPIALKFLTQAQFGVIFLYSFSPLRKHLPISAFFLWIYILRESRRPAEQHVRGGEAWQRVALLCQHSSCATTWAVVHLRNRGLGALSGSAPAPVWIQGGVRQPQTRRLWPFASRNSGICTISCQTQPLLYVFLICGCWSFCQSWNRGCVC